MRIMLAMRLLLIFLLALSHSLSAWELPKSSSQAIVGVAKSWDSSYVTLQLYEKSRGRWTPVGKSWTGRLGKNGLAWGRGISPLKRSPHLKREGDSRAPAGVFLLGGAYGTHAKIDKKFRLPYTRVTSRDLWVEDSSSPYYNRHLRLNHEPTTAWEKKAQMRQNDYPHSLKLYIGHNTASNQRKAIPNAGSAIFFHIWRRGGKSATAGCTTMHESHLRHLISQINPNKNPLYILLPQSEYTKLRTDWKLP